MPRQLAPVLWTETGIVLDPNLEDFGVPAWVIRALRGTPGERPRTIRAGVLQCQRCAVMPERTSASVHLRRHPSGRLIVAHHASASGPCYLPESPEHQALKERVATSAQGHGFAVRTEVATADRKGRADVEVTGPGGRRIGHEIQLSTITNTVVSRRSNTARRDGRIPSWLTTDQSAHSATRTLIDRVPWAMSNRLHPELLRRGRPMRVSAGLGRLDLVRCRDLPGMCPNRPQERFCSGWHTRWDNVAVPIEEFVGHTAAGTYLPVALPAQGRGARRRWITPADRELFIHATGLDLAEEALRVPSPPRDRSGEGSSDDSKLHRPDEEQGPKRRSRARARVSEVARGDVVVGTLDRMPDHLREDAPAAGEGDERAPAGGQAVWEEAAAAVPCRYYLGQESGVCGSTPSRFYARGRRCYEHAPNAMSPVTPI